MGDVFGPAESSNIVLGCLKFPIFFGGGGVKCRCWART